MSAGGTPSQGDVIERAKLRELLFGGRFGKILSEKLLAFLVDCRQAIQEACSLFRKSPFRQNEIDKFINASALRARSVRGGNDLVDHRHDRVVEMSGEST